MVAGSGGVPVAASAAGGDPVWGGFLLRLRRRCLRRGSYPPRLTLGLRLWKMTVLPLHVVDDAGYFLEACEGRPLRVFVEPWLAVLFCAVGVTELRRRAVTTAVPPPGFSPLVVRSEAVGPSLPLLWRCKVADCGAEFSTYNKLMAHYNRHHRLKETSYR